MKPVIQEACQQFKKKYKQRVVIFTDDIQKCTPDNKHLSPEADQLACFYLELYNMGLVNCVYSVTDYQAVGMLHKLSGHSTRLISEILPSIPDKQLQEQLQKLALVTRANSSGSEPILTFIKADGKEGNFDRENKCFVFQDPQEIEYLVSNLDSHMGSLTRALDDVIRQRQSVKDVVDRIVSQDIPVIASVLSGESCGDIDRNVFILVAWCIFEQLVLCDQVRWDSVFESHQALDRFEVQRAVRRLVFINVLSYVDWDSVCFHRRSIGVAFGKRRVLPSHITTRDVAMKTEKDTE